VAGPLDPRVPVEVPLLAHVTGHVLAWAREAGHPTMVTGWRAANLVASRFWAARGLRPALLRLHRVVGVG
jgi:hypothetical protein